MAAMAASPVAVIEWRTLYRGIRFGLHQFVSIGKEFERRELRIGLTRMEKDYLTLKPAATSRSSGTWSDDDYDVLAEGEVVGRIMKANAAPAGMAWMWTLAFGQLEQLRARSATLQQQRESWKLLVKELEQLRARSATLQQQRESWKLRALMAEAQLLETTAKASSDVLARNVSDVRYASLKRFLAKRFHSDYAPGQGIEKILRNEIFKEIWSEVERLDHAGAGTRSVGSDPPRRHDDISARHAPSHRSSVAFHAVVWPAYGAS
jgi:hypothetical protein